MFVMHHFQYAIAFEAYMTATDLEQSISLVTTVKMIDHVRFSISRAVKNTSDLKLRVKLLHSSILHSSIAVLQKK